MQSMTIQQAAEATGWSQRMLRYLEQAGLVAALRTPGGHRHYGPRQIERLRKLRELLDTHELGITDITFELRMRTEPQLARSVDEWFGPIHRAAAPPGAGIYRRLAAPDEPHPSHRDSANPGATPRHVLPRPVLNRETGGRSPSKVGWVDGGGDVRHETR
jgi:adenosylhomocysteinase